MTEPEKPAAEASPKPASNDIGCISLIVYVTVVIALFAVLIGGVTIDGVNYDVSCSCGRGLEFAKTPVPPKEIK